MYTSGEEKVGKESGSEEKGPIVMIWEVKMWYKTQYGGKEEMIWEWGGTNTTVLGRASENCESWYWPIEGHILTAVP
jgi:hypothetical protein